MDVNTDKEECDGHIITATSASSSPNGYDHNDESTTFSSTVQFHQEQSPSSIPPEWTSLHDKDDASADHNFHAASTKNIAQSAGAVAAIKNAVIDKFMPPSCGPEVIVDVGPPVPVGMMTGERLNDFTASKKYVAMGIELVDENEGPNPPACMIAMSPLEQDKVARKKRGTRAQVTTTEEEGLVIDDDSIHVDDVPTDDISVIQVPHAWRVTETEGEGHVTSNQEDMGTIIIATPTLPWWKYRRAQLLIGTVFILFAAMAIALVIALTSNKNFAAPVGGYSAPSQSPHEEQELTSHTDNPPQSPFVQLQTSPSCNQSHTNNSMVNFGYYQEWAQYRPFDCNPLSPQLINVTAFGYTHLAYAYGGINTDGFIEPYDGAIEQNEKYSAFNSLKSSNPDLKTLISVGGWTFDQSRFVLVSSTESRRTAFANSVVAFLEEHDFDGIDLDWEFPVTRQGTAADYVNYPLLCQALRMAFTDAGRSDWLITVQTSINSYDLMEGFDLLGMAPHIDWFNLMSYNIYGEWDEVTGANTDMSYINETMAYIFETGLLREKLVLGLAAYGRSTTLTDPSCITAGCPISGPGLTGCHGESGTLPWFEIKENYLDDPGMYDSLSYNPLTESMELITDGNTTFTSFDNESTFNKKYQYASSECLRGIMWWSVDTIKDPAL